MADRAARSVAGMPSTATSESPVRAPRWAAWIAALLGLHYVAGKLVMAARGELGLPDHPAPPEAYERFAGDVALAQVGNAALGSVTVLIALAFVLPWGRRLPAVALAAGATGALLSGLAASAVVVASITGLREDHGQWTALALATDAVALPAWTVLAVAGWRAVRLPVRPVRRRRRAVGPATGEARR